MKPIFLKFRGINSYEEEFCVDFESLAKDGIFGIFGPTGSGKSTILDAITLALYGKVPRHNKNTHSSFINTASETAEVHFVFEAAMRVGGKSRFEIHRVYKRNNKGGVNVSKCLFRLTDGDILADRKEGEVNAAINAAVGLSYDDFTRSVFLPQGKFNEFMFLDSKDRGKMLERLFDLEEFGERLKLRVNAFESRAKMAVETCQLKVSFYGEISKELLAAKQDKLSVISEEIARLTEKRELFFAQREKYRALEAAYGQYLAARQELERLAAQAAEIEGAAAVLGGAKKASALQMPMDGLKSLTQQHEQAIESLAATQKLAKAVGAQAEKCEAEYRAARAAMETDFPDLLRKEQELNAHLERLREIEALEKEREELRARWKAAEEELNQKKLKEEKAGAKAAEIKALLDDVAQEKLDAGIDPESLKSLIDAAGLEKELRRKNDEIGVLETELSKHIEAVSGFAIDLTAKEHELSELFAKIESSLAGQLAQNLEDGLPCPVCGSLEHPKPARHGLHIAESDAHLERLQNEINNIKVKLGRARAMEENCAESLKKLAKDKAALVDSLAKYQKTLHTDSFEAALKAAIEKNTRRAALEEQEAALRAELDAVAEAQKSLFLEISQLGAAQDATRAAGLEKASVIEAKTAELGAFGDRLAAKAALSEVESQKLALTVALKESEDLKNKYQTEFVEAEKGLASLTERVQNLAAVRDAQQAAIEKELTACGFNSIAAAETAILPQSQMAVLEAEIRAYEQRTAELTNLLGSLSETLAEIDSPADIPEIAREAQEKFAATDATLMEKREVLAILSQEAAKMKTDLETVAELLAQKKGLEARHAALREIADLFRGNAFIKFLATRHLQYITNEATARLARMTGGRYAIEYDEDTNFIIRDDFNGGARRPPASLSGGETFMASLCLALALAAKIQMKSRTDLSFFFLDEGFGALDKDSLEGVVDALTALREENMAVGLITHVEELKSRIVDKIEL